MSLNQSSLRNDFSRAQLTADFAERKANEAKTLANMLVSDFGDHVRTAESSAKLLKELADEFNAWKLYAKAAGLIFGFIQLFTVPLIVEALKRMFFPSMP